ncbi:MAG: class I SAM-dependent methyltransferase [Halobacteriovoraceae bacterium]|jgi:hypothetical protein|nr:class I SAM-dependent methyltransferase [Halobacteriovoraceae bacterium]
MSFDCPLCLNQNAIFEFHQKLHKRDFYRCPDCDLTFVDRSQLLQVVVEKSRYDLHENHIRSKGYERFLRRLVDPLIANISNKDARGLDYGCGPYPMLIEIMGEEGFTNFMGFDPIYANKNSHFNQKYDFLTLCEVIEHMNNPRQEIERIAHLLNSDALFVISTGLRTANIDLGKWHYINDDTHINLFSLKTFHWIQEFFSFDLHSQEKDLIILLKK